MEDKKLFEPGASEYLKKLYGDTGVTIEKLSQEPIGFIQFALLSGQGKFGKRPPEMFKPILEKVKDYRDSNPLKLEATKIFLNAFMAWLNNPNAEMNYFVN